MIRMSDHLEPFGWRRRDLLGALRAASHELSATAQLSPKQRRLLAFRRRAMACEFELLLPQSRATDSDAAVAALDEIEAAEALLSIYRDGSELSTINRAASQRRVRVSPPMAEFLTVCRRIWESTGGAFDPAAGALVELWGFRERRPRRPADVEIADTLGRVGFQHVDFDPTVPEIHFARAGIILNPGAIGKGWSIDRATDVLLRRGVDNFLIQAGGSSVRACGPGPDAESDSGWPVALPDGESLLLHDAALGTSGSDQLFLDADGVRYSHVIDPRNGRAAIRETHVSVRAQCAGEADALATALFVMNDAEAAEMLRGMPDVEAHTSDRADRAGGFAP